MNIKKDKSRKELSTANVNLATAIVNLIIAVINIIAIIRIY